MKSSASSPNGHRYLLAPLKGKQADIITALNSRTVGSNTPHGQIQVLLWNLQAGMKYEELAPDNKLLVDRFLPDFKPRLQRSFYESILATWDQLSNSIPGLPSMDVVLGELGELGQFISTLLLDRDTILQYGSDFESLSRLFVLPDTSYAAGESANTPWSRIDTRVYSRLITEGNFASPAELQIRVIPVVSTSASKSSSNVTRERSSTPLANSPVRVSITNLVADPQNSSVQPLSISPKQESEDEFVGEASYSLPDFWPEPHYIDMEFRSCSEAENYLDSQKANEYTAEVVSGELVTEPAQIDATSLTDGRVQAEVTVNYRIDPPVRSITLLRFNWPNMTPTERDSLQNFYDALMNHEEGHVELAQAFADKNSGRRVSAIGATAEQARANLQTQVEKIILEDARDDLRRIQNEYDEMTDHGANQATVQEWTNSIEYPNIAVGPNVQLSCP